MGRLTQPRFIHPVGDLTGCEVVHRGVVNLGKQWLAKRDEFVGGFTEKPKRQQAEFDVVAHRSSAEQGCSSETDRDRTLKRIGGVLAIAEDKLIAERLAQLEDIALVGPLVSERSSGGVGRTDRLAGSFSPP